MAFIQVITTTGTKEQAEAIARRLVEDKLAACVQIAGGIESVYSWQGKIERSREYLCLIKTHADLFTRVAEVIKTLHSYEVPEIIAVPIINGDREYMTWLTDTLAGEP